MTDHSQTMSAETMTLTGSSRIIMMKRSKDMEQHKMSSKAEIRASRKYNQQNAVTLSLTLNRKYDADIIEQIEKVDSKAQYVKQLIRADLAKKQAEATVFMQFADTDTTQVSFAGADEQTAAYVATQIYNALPESIQEQIEILVVASKDSPDGYDIVEATLFDDIDE